MRNSWSIEQKITRLCALVAVTLCGLSGNSRAQLERPQLPSVALKGVSAEQTEAVNDIIEQNLLLSGTRTGTAPLADDLAFFLRRFYDNQGYEGTDVDWSLTNGVIGLNVREGRRLTIGAISISGVPAEETEKLRDYLLRPTRERYKSQNESEPDPLPFVETDVLSGGDLALRHLLSEGFEEAVTDPVRMTRTTDGKVNLGLNVRPGRRWKFARVGVSGLPPGFGEKAAELTEGMAGAHFSAARMESVRGSLESAIQEAGYYRAAVEAQYQKIGSQKAYSVNFAAKPGLPHRITKVIPRGELTEGAARVIRGSFRPEIGRVYDAEQLDIAFRRVLDTGMFEELRTELQPEGQDGLQVFVDGDETNRYIFGVFAGFDTFNGPILGGTAQATHWPKPGDLMRAEIESSARGVNGTLSWIDPAIFETPYSLQVDLRSRYFTFKGYDLYSAELLGTLRRKYTREFSASVYAGVSINESSSDTLTEAQLGPSSYQLGRAGLTARYDNRDSPVLPKKGVAVNFGLEFAQGTGDSAFNYVKTDASAAWFFQLSDKWRGYVGGRHANLYGVTAEDVPLHLRLFNGGMNTVRGFEERLMGAHAKDGTPLGGTQTGSITLEVMREMAPNLDLATFYDGGFVSDSSSMFVPDSADLRHSVGMGIRYQLPFGPMRLDYAVNLNPDEREPFGTLHLGFGFSW